MSWRGTRREENNNNPKKVQMSHGRWESHSCNKDAQAPGTGWAVF